VVREIFLKVMNWESQLTSGLFSNHWSDAMVIHTKILFFLHSIDLGCYRFHHFLVIAMTTWPWLSLRINGAHDKRPWIMSSIERFLRISRVATFSGFSVMGTSETLRTFPYCSTISINFRYNHDYQHWVSCNVVTWVTTTMQIILGLLKVIRMHVIWVVPTSTLEWV